jgi:hypothetical protein
MMLAGRRGDGAAAGAYDCVRVHVELLGSDGGDACVAVQVGLVLNVTIWHLFQFLSSTLFIFLDIALGPCI